MRTPPCAHGFTLIELMIVVAIVGVLLTLLLPTASRAIKAARGFKCQMAQRAVAFDFQIFADDRLHGSRGHDDALATGRFRLETFQESQYQIDEFWKWGETPEVTMPDAQGNDPMRCAAVKGEITLRRNEPCTGNAISPRELISFGFNMRLHRRAADGRPVQLSSRILEEAGNVPLLWDVDGEVAAARNLVPVFSAPSLGEGGMLADDRFWFPAARHNGAANYAFIDGHVESSAKPLDMTDWDWTYVPR